MKTTNPNATILPERQNNEMEEIFVPYGKMPISRPLWFSNHNIMPLILCLFLSVIGNWGSWSVWSCTKTCGGGVQTRIRHCNDPAPVPEIGCVLSDEELRAFNETGHGGPCNEQQCRRRKKNIFQILNNFLFWSIATFSASDSIFQVQV